MKDTILEMLKYNQWANQEYLTFLKEKHITNARIDMLMSHMANIQELWIKRLKQQSYQITDTWEKWHFEEYSNSIKEIDQQIIELVSSYTEEQLNEGLDYKNAQGLTYHREIRHILIHWVNDCTYHRAQVGLLIREEFSYIPPATDFIFYETDMKQLS